MADTRSARDFLEALQHQEGVGGWDKALLKDLKLVSLERGRVVCTLPVTEAVANPMRTLHGGCAGAGGGHHRAARMACMGHDTRVCTCTAS
jgi:acyl-coenzyme A thioesterase PaaI-like protein